jgi:Ras-related protein Rab-6A
LRYIKEAFSEDLKKTIGTNFLIKEVEVDNIICRLLIWDIGGQSQFSSLRQVYFKGSQAAIGVYDITSPESLHRILDWIASVKKSVGNIPIILLGTMHWI